jgi:hypothetical protein
MRSIDMILNPPIPGEIAPEGLSATPREIASRLSGSDEVLLLWHPERDQLELSVRDVETGAGVYLEIARDSAIDAFNHPYAYIGLLTRSVDVVPAMWIVDDD